MDFARFDAVSGNSDDDSPTDQEFTVGNGPGATKARPFRIDLEDLDHNRGAVLMFQVRGTNGSHLKMVNQPKVDAAHRPPKQALIKDLQLDDTFKSSRSWHEIVQGDQFSTHPNVNELTISVTDTPTGQSVTVSDVVLFYHAKTTP